MGAPLLGADGMPATGQPPEVLLQPTQPQAGGPIDPVSAFTAYNVSLGNPGVPMSAEERAAQLQPQPPALQTPAPAPAPPDSLAPQPPAIPGLDPVVAVPEGAGAGEPEAPGVHTIDDVAASFYGDDGQAVGTEAFLAGVTHRVGDRDVPLNEIISGYTAMPDAEAAVQERAALENELSQREYELNGVFDTAMSDVAAMQVQLRARFKAESDPAQMLQLAQTDPARYQETLARNEATRQLLENNDAEMKRQYEAAQDRQQKQLGEYRAKERRNLQRIFPEWLDETDGKNKKVQAAVASYLEDMGFDGNEITGIEDSRMLAVARDAAIGRKVKEKGQATIRAARDKQLLPPAAKPTARVEQLTNSQQGDQGRADAFKDLQTNKDIDSAAAVFARIT